MNEFFLNAIVTMGLPLLALMLLLLWLMIIFVIVDEVVDVIWAKDKKHEEDLDGLL